MSIAMQKVPVTVLTGHLGSGKTTLLNRILTGQRDKKYAVIVNEFGEIGIDNDLIVESDEEIYEMNNGCICCTVRGDLIGILHKLLRRPGRFDAIVVETTGVADPAPVVQTFMMDEQVRDKTELDAVVTLVDAKHFPLRLADSQEAEDQIVYADVVLINKVDLVSPEQVDQVQRQVAAINPYAICHRVQRAEVDLSRVLAIGAFDLQRWVALQAQPVPGGTCGMHGHGQDHHDHHGHTHADDEPCQDHVGHHRHEISVMSVSLQAGMLDANRFFPWIQGLVDAQGPNILRMKGILALADEERRYVIQGVHMIVEGEHQRSWRHDEARDSKLVFIGRNLDAEVLRAGFLLCQA
ncbi:GTP-binding protein [Orrella sp. JC864]|uniref:CobW family GTP-binding protein n=1 Tax=Orrella sp. JC864 TaxID=3120298 RepID=UPI003009F38B